MAIPDHPNWSSLTDVKSYPVPEFSEPAPIGIVSASSLGPTELNQSGGKLNSRYWTVTQEGGAVVIRGSIT